MVTMVQQGWKLECKNETKNHNVCFNIRLWCQREYMTRSAVRLTLNPEQICTDVYLHAFHTVLSFPGTGNSDMGPYSGRQGTGRGGYIQGGVRRGNHIILL